MPLAFPLPFFNAVAHLWTPLIFINDRTQASSNNQKKREKKNYKNNIEIWMQTNISFLLLLAGFSAHIVVVLCCVYFAARLKRVFWKGFYLCECECVCVCGCSFKLWLWIDYQVNMSPLDWQLPASSCPASCLFPPSSCLLHIQMRLWCAPKRAVS